MIEISAVSDQKEIFEMDTAKCKAINSSKAVFPLLRQQKELYDV